MWKWTKKKLGYRKDIEDLKAKYVHRTFNTDQERADLFFNPVEFNPIIDRDQRLVGFKNKDRMLVRAFQRYNYYCSQYRIHQGVYNKLCDEDKYIIKKYYDNSNVKFIIMHDEELDIYQLNTLNITSKQKEDTSRNYFIGNKIFTDHEWKNIMFYFKGIIFITQKEKEEKTMSLNINDNDTKLKKLNEELELLEKEKKELEESLNEEFKGDDIHNQNKKIDDINEKINTIIYEIAEIEENNYVDDERLTEYGGRKKRRKTIKRKTIKRKNNKKRRKTRKY